MVSDWKMDVTSLLNQSASSGCDRIEGETTPTSTAFKQGDKKSASLPTPSPERTTPQQDWESKSTKNRSPWSAGGYALPLQSDPEFRSSSTFSFRSGSEVLDSDSSVDSLGLGRHSRRGSTDSASIDMECSQMSLPFSRLQKGWSNNWEDRSQTGVEARELMGHKFSDSHSSLSSYASWRSRSHSRISSATTVSGIHSARPSLTELPLLETAMASHGESYQTPTSANRTPLSSAGRLPTKNRTGEMDVPIRSGSPSDAVLNMKGALKPAPMGTPTGDASSGEPRFPGVSSSHKRAISAPDSSNATEHFRPKHAQHPRSVLPPPREGMAIAEDTTSPLAVGQTGPQNEGVGPKYNVLDDHDNSEPDRQVEMPLVAAPKPMRALSSPAISSEAPSHEHDQLTKPSKTSTTLAKNLGGKAACMFVHDCDTGSQLRKAISHLFGRNKTCTLKIPEMVWVYYCRKHYQRVRYRNAKTYPITQMELVQTQIERLKAWSDRNRATGEGPYINSWTLSLRKREEKRLQGDKRRNDKGKEPSEVGTSHIPAWIIEELGEGFDTERMFKIAGRLHEEIMSGLLTQVPEIEFLPDIVGDDKDKEAKSTRQRRQNSSTSLTKTPKRKAPDFQVMTQPSSMYHDMGYAAYVHDGGYDAEDVASPSGKRPRTARAATFIAGPSNSYTTSPYLAGPDVLPRAQNVVPKIQPIDYHNPYAHHVSNGRFEHTHPAQGHARVASYSNVPIESEYALEPCYQHQKAAGYGQMPVHFSGGQSNPNSPPLLPSITAQMNNTSISYERHESPLSGARSQTRGPSRPMHQRSASAYIPGRRYVPMSGRPSSSGNGHTVEHARYEANRQVSPPAMYGAGHDGPQSYAAGGDLRHHRYDEKPVWVSSYAHPVPPLPNHHAQYSYPHGSSYGPPSHAGMNPHNGGPGDGKNGISVYPEPKGALGIRSA